jgi:hypothetical protein
MKKKCEEDCCPFAFTEQSEMAQGYGCLPNRFEIQQMRIKHGKTWACHSDKKKPCVGAIKYMQEKGIECKVIDENLVTDEDDWSKYV